MSIWHILYAMKYAFCIENINIQNLNLSNLNHFNCLTSIKLGWDSYI